MKSIRIPYKSGWYTVVLPTLLFLAVWGGTTAAILAALGWSAPGALGVLICGVGVLPGLAAAVALYPLLLRLAERGRGELWLEGTRLGMRRGLRRRTIDLARPHRARIAADATAAALTLQNKPTYLHIVFRGLSRRRVLALFPAPYFIDDLVITPEMGSWGFDGTVGDPRVEDFALLFLETLWQQRHQNRSYLLYARYPWERPPRPAFPFIRLIDWEKRSAADEAWIAQLLEQCVDGLSESSVRLTPDYLVGWVYRSLRSTLSGYPDYYCILPLGHIQAEASLPRPDWKPFIVGHILKEALAATLGTQPPSGGPQLQHRHYLYVRGRDPSGAPLELAFDWYGPGHPDYEEAQFVVRFVNRWVAPG